MLEEMAAEYGYAPVSEEPPKKPTAGKKKTDDDGHRQTNLFDF